jgi:2-polyprenyl-6-methoxyphenol hydroxylase-like FAD-dependent oxidoreductase
MNCMFGEKTPEVLVVGAGPVGLYAALNLANQGIRVRIVDTGIWACKRSFALALHPESLDLMKHAGLLGSILERAYRVEKVALYDETGRRAEVRLGTAKDPSSCLAVLPQERLERLLENALQDAGVRVDWRHEVHQLTQRDGQVIATINKFDKESRGYVIAHTEWVIAKTAEVPVHFVLGADGYDSTVRRALNIAFPEVGPAQYYAVFEFGSSADLGHEMRVNLTEGATDVLWPLPEGRCRWSFQLPDYSDPAAEGLKDRLEKAGFGDFPTERFKDRYKAREWSSFPVLEEENLRTFIAQRAPWFEGSIQDIAWRTVIRFERRLAGAFGSGRVWLAGDAAHLTGPIGVNSMNAGLMEAHELTNSMAQILRRGGSVEQLNSHSELWLSTWRRLQGMEGGFQTDAETDPWISRNAGRLVGVLPAQGQRLIPVAAQLHLQV